MASLVCQRVCIYARFVIHGVASFHCGLGDSNNGDRSTHLPQWMFDAVACCDLRLTPTPVVSCEALSALKVLIACREEAQTAAVEAAILASNDEARKRDQVLEALERDLQAARYVASRAHKQYDATDPENRLVALSHILIIGFFLSQGFLICSVFLPGFGPV
jgi:hypothetical protein